MIYKYWAFGVTISSTIEFPELIPFDFVQADVEIVLGRIPSSVKDGVFLETQRFSYRILDNECVFEVKSVGRYYTSYGKLLVIEPFNESIDLRLVRMNALGTAMASLLLQRKLFPMHASAVIKKDKVVLLMGESGAGKSTMFTKLIQRGNYAFSDDAIVLEAISDGKLNVRASYPMIRLWKETLENLNDESLSNLAFQVKPDLDKYGVFFHNNFNTNKFEVSKIILLKKTIKDEITSVKLDGKNAFKEVSKHVFRPMLLQSLELKMISFKIISNLTQTSEVYEVHRPDNCDPDNLVTYIEKLLL